MYIAVQVQEVLLGNDRVLFKPIGLIKGDYDKETDIFIDEYGYVYKSMSGDDLYSDRYFCSPMTMEKLRNIYKDLGNDVVVLEEFLATVMESYYIGYYDELTGKIKLLDINSNNIEAAIANKEYDLGINEEEFDKIEVDDEGNERYIFNRAALEGLRNYSSIEEVREYVDELIETCESIKDYFISSEPEEKKEKFIIEWETYYTILGIEEKKYTNQQLLNIVKKCIENINLENLSPLEKDKKINKILDAYNGILEENRKKVKKYVK